MNINEWQKTLLKQLKSLPSDERRRIAEYYDELFADRMDAGQKEADIVDALGDPANAAEKILKDYDAYLKREDGEIEAAEEAGKTEDISKEPYAGDGKESDGGLRDEKEHTFETDTDKATAADFDDDDEKKGAPEPDDEKFDGSVYTSETNHKFDAVRKIKIDVNVAEVIITREKKFSLKVSESGDARFDIDVGGDTLYIKEHAKTIGAMFKNMFGFGKKSLKIYIALPELEAVTCNAIKNGCRIDGFTLRRATIETVSGDISLKSCDTEYLRAEATNGDIEMSGGIHESVSLNTTSGDISAKSFSAKTLSLTSVSGDIDASDLKASEKATVRTIGGDAKVMHLASDNIEVKTMSGDIDVSIVGKSSEYGVRTKTLSGDIHSSKCGVDGEKKCVSASTLSGDIRLSFTE